jgi:hypothetical protein
MSVSNLDPSILIPGALAVLSLIALLAMLYAHRPRPREGHPRTVRLPGMEIHTEVQKDSLAQAIARLHGDGPGVDASHSPPEDRPAEGGSAGGKAKQPHPSQLGRGKWVWPPMKVRLHGEHFEVQADGAVYYRSSIKAGPRYVERVKRLNPDATLSTGDRVPGPMRRINESDEWGAKIAAAARDEVRRIMMERRVASAAPNTVVPPKSGGLL